MIQLILLSRSLLSDIIWLSSVFVVLTSGVTATTAMIRSFDGGGRQEKQMNHHRHSHGYKVRGRRDIINKEVEDYLTKFGYLPQSDLETGMLRTVEQLEDPIRNLQGFAGIDMTGRIDQQTKDLIYKKRCGVQDVSIGFRNKRSIRVKRYNLQGQRWSHNNLTWSLRRAPVSGYISRDVVRREITFALSVWARHTLLTFTETYDDSK